MRGACLCGPDRPCDNQLEAEIQERTKLALAGNRRVRIWRANVLAAWTDDGQLIRAGKEGQADLSGIIDDGRRLEIELKSRKGRQRQAQERFQEMIRRYGGVYIIGRCVTRILQELEAALGEGVPR